jgi:hypothetical protein
MGYDRALVVSMCVYDSDYSPSCADKTIAEAAKKLGEIYENEVLGRWEQRTFELIFPASVVSFALLLQDIEKRSVKVTEALMRAQVVRLTPFEWQAEANRQINNWVIRANRAAETGEHWTSTGNTHTFRLGPSYGQLEGLNLHLQSWD